MAGSLRQSVERGSVGPLLTLRRLPRLVVALAPAVLLLLVLVAPPPLAVVALAIAVLFPAWLTYLSWPALTPNARLARVGVLALIVAVGLLRLAT